MPKTRDWLHVENTYKRDDDAQSMDARLGETASKLKALQQKIKAQVDQPTTFMGQLFTEIREVLLSNKLNVLLLFIPFALISYSLNWNKAATFVLALLPLCSLAERLGFVTEQLAMYTNETLGGLLNASFGNATEVIVAAFALAKNKRRLVQLSLLGSVISNLLLVLGSAFLAGGLKWPMQQFNKKGANVHCGLLILGCVAVLLPSALSETKTTVGRNGGAASRDASQPLDKPDRHELGLSRFEAVIMLLLYGAYLLFQLLTHKHLFEEEEADTPPSSDGSSEFVKLAKKDTIVDAEQGPKTVEMFHNGSRPAPAGEDHAPDTPSSAKHLLEHRTDQSVAGDNDDDELVLSYYGSITWLAVITIFIALMSEPLTETIEQASDAMNIGKPFMYTIILPIVGNAAEHTSAIVFAMKNRMELSLGVAVGSATQVLVLVVPLCVVLGWTMGTELDLDFNTFEALSLFIGVLLAIIVVQDGYSHWLKGVVLVVTYLFTAAAFWSHYDERLVVDGRLG